MLELLPNKLAFRNRQRCWRVDKSKGKFIIAIAVFMFGGFRVWKFKAYLHSLCQKRAGLSPLFITIDCSSRLWGCYSFLTTSDLSEVHSSSSDCSPQIAIASPLWILLIDLSSHTIWRRKADSHQFRPRDFELFRRSSRSFDKYPLEERNRKILMFTRHLPST